MKRLVVFGAWAALALGVALMARAEATFKEGRGVVLDAELLSGLGLQVVDVEERSEPLEIEVSAQVYREASEESASVLEPTGYAYASGWISSELRKHVAPGAKVAVDGLARVTGRVVRVDRAAALRDGRVEVLIQLPSGEREWRIGDFVRIELKAVGKTAALRIPESAVLNTAYGAVAHVVNGDAFLRTPVKLGARSEGWVSIRDGLYDGDQVVVGPVESLYLIELRATKGGGHSH